MTIDGVLFPPEAGEIGNVPPPPPPPDWIALLFYVALAITIAVAALHAWRTKDRYSWALAGMVAVVALTNGVRQLMVSYVGAWYDDGGQPLPVWYQSHAIHLVQIAAMPTVAAHVLGRRGLVNSVTVGAMAVVAASLWLLVSPDSYPSEQVAMAATGVSLAAVAYWVYQREGGDEPAALALAWLITADAAVMAGFAGRYYDAADWLAGVEHWFARGNAYALALVMASLILVRGLRRWNGSR